MIFEILWRWRDSLWAVWLWFRFLEVFQTKIPGDLIFQHFYGRFLRFFAVILIFCQMLWNCFQYSLSFPWFFFLLIEKYFAGIISHFWYTVRAEGGGVKIDVTLAEILRHCPTWYRTGKYSSVAKPTSRVSTYLLASIYTDYDYHMISNGRWNFNYGQLNCQLLGCLLAKRQLERAGNFERAPW